MPEIIQGGERIYRGIAVSAGICRGKVLVLGQSKESLPVHSISAEDVPGELHRLEQALVQTRHQILDVQRRVEKALGSEDASIFEAHLLVLDDRTLLDEVTRITEEEKINVEAAFHKVASRYADTLNAMADEYLRERASDMRDVTERVLNNLLQRDTGENFQNLAEPVILVCHDLPPSTAAALDRQKILGLATDAGSRTSHTAIMARSLHLPAVVALRDATSRLATGDYALLDGYSGTLIVNPTDQTLFEYGQLVRKHVDFEEKLRDLRDKPAVTLDGARIGLRANIEQPGDAEAVKAVGLEGVGLFRTEYLFINRETMPSEEEQLAAYAAVAEALKPAEVVIRTLDLGGDKLLTHSQSPPEMNPFLGWRAIRFCLSETETFRTQLRAILRASTHGNIRMMYPMISGLDEVRQANALLDECKAELRAAGVPFDEKLGAGIMIEIPSAALIADTLGKHVQFFSIGTNDLIQYSLAVDRLNEKIAHLYEPTHPGILALIKMTAEAGARNGIPVSVCGEMAGDPVMTPILIGLGVTELSVNPSVAPQIKFLLRRLKLSEAKELARFALESDSPSETVRRAEQLVRGVAPGLLTAGA